MDIFTEWLKREENLDQNLMPFGLISWDVIEEAKELLQEVKYGFLHVLRKKLLVRNSRDDCAKHGGEELFTMMHCARITNL